jgi:hypothetical protein
MVRHDVANSDGDSVNPLPHRAVSVTGVVALVYIAFGTAFILRDYTFNNEGLLTFYWADWARHAFVPTFFFQKIKPVLSAVYAPVTALGLHPTLIAHLLVAAAAIPMMHAIACALGYRLPVLPALLLAASPLYFYGGPAGLSNVDGVVGIVSVLYLWCARRQPLGAGLVAGALPWVRFELVLFVAALGLHGLICRRDRRIILGLGVFPALYAVCGAFYHGDLLWLMHFPPSAPFDPGNPIYGSQLIGLQFFLEPLLALTPLAALIGCVPFRRLQCSEWVLFAYSVITMVVMNVFPILRIGNFGTAPRYFLHVLPPLVLLTARAIEPWWDGKRPKLPAFGLVLLVALWSATRHQTLSVSASLMALYLVLLLVVWIKPGRVAVALAGLIAVAGPLLPVRVDITRTVAAKYLDGMVEWIDQHPELHKRPIYTNAQLIGPYLERHLPGLRIYHVAGEDMVRELTMLTNPRNGQRERILQLSRDNLYGQTLFGPIHPEDLPPDALLLLREDARLPQFLPDAVWAGRLIWIEKAQQFRVAQLIKP